MPPLKELSKVDKLLGKALEIYRGGKRHSKEISLVETGLRDRDVLFVINFNHCDYL
jgi:hypothetical protein